MRESAEDSHLDAEEQLRIRFGQRIRELRLAKGLNQDEFAFKARLHRSHIGFLENGKRDPQLTTIYRLSVALDVDLPTLLETVQPDRMDD